MGGTGGEEVQAAHRDLGRVLGEFLSLVQGSFLPIARQIKSLFVLE